MCVLSPINLHRARPKTYKMSNGFELLGPISLPRPNRQMERHSQRVEQRICHISRHSTQTLADCQFLVQRDS